MRRRRWILLAAMLAALCGCNSRRGLPLNTSAYAGVDQGVVLAWAWGGAAGFEDAEPHEVIVLFAPEPGDSDFRLTTCDRGKDDCKSIAAFVDTGLQPRFEESSIFGQFDTDIVKQDREFLVVATRGSRLVTSTVISAAASSRPTVFSGGELRFDRSTQQLAWPRLQDNDLFVVTISDQDSGRPLTAIATRRKSWTYPELQGIVQYFHDAAGVRELAPSGRYVAVLYSLNKQRWATVVTNAVIKP